MDDAYPTDVHFVMGRSETPFGRSNDTPMQGVTIHYCIVQGSAFQSGAHENGIERTYTLMAEFAGGKLATFSTDIAECTRRFARGEISNSPTHQHDAADANFAMISGEMNTKRVRSVAPNNASPQLVAAIKSGEVTMVRLRIYDNSTEDGDVVSISAPGFNKTITLTNLGETLDVPLVRGAMMLTGEADGVGGITVSVDLPDGTHIINGSMSVGEQIALSIPQ